MADAPTAEPGDKPAEIIDSAGRWLADQLDEFHWVKSRRDLRHSRGAQEIRVHLQASKWNRAGIGTWVSPRVTVSDEVLDRWRDAKSASPIGRIGWVYNTLLINISPRLVSVECSGLPQPETPNAPIPRSLNEFAADLRTEVLPVIEVFSDPDLAAEALPEAWLAMISAGTIEWALARSRQDAAARLVRRHIERQLKGSQTWDARINQFTEGWNSDDRPDDPIGGLASMGWLSRRFDLVTPTELVPPAPATAPLKPRGLLRLVKRSND